MAGRVLLKLDYLLARRVLGLSRILQTAVLAPRMNATCERLIGTLRRELLNRMLILNVVHLRAVLTGYQVHYNCARPHQGIAQRVPDAGRDTPRPPITDLDTGQIRRKPVPNGLINEYTRRLTPRQDRRQPNPIFERDRVELTAWDQARGLPTTK